jgi:hypothetical protein
MMLQLIKYKQIKKILTKEVEVQAFVRHVLIDQHLFILFVRELSPNNSLHVIKNSNVLSSEDKDSISRDKPFII